MVCFVERVNTPTIVNLDICPAPGMVIPSRLVGLSRLAAMLGDSLHVPPLATSISHAVACSVLGLGARACCVAMFLLPCWVLHDIRHLAAGPPARSRVQGRTRSGLLLPCAMCITFTKGTAPVAARQLRG